MWAGAARTWSRLEGSSSPPSLSSSSSPEAGDSRFFARGTFVAASPAECHCRCRCHWETCLVLVLILSTLNIYPRVLRVLSARRDLYGAASLSDAEPKSCRNLLAFLELQVKLLPLTCNPLFRCAQLSSADCPPTQDQSTCSWKQWSPLRGVARCCTAKEIWVAGLELQ